MNGENLQAVLIVVTLIVASFALYRSYKSGEIITLNSAVDSVREARPVAVQLAEIAQIAANSVEQLRREGKLQENDVAFNYALNLVKKWIPDEWEIDNEDIINGINAAVLVSSALRREAGVSSENDTIQRQSQ